MRSLQAFVLGALARAISTLIVYPYIRAKVENDKIFPTFTPALALSRRPTPNCNQTVILTHNHLHPQRTCPPAKMLTMLKDKASGPKALEGAKAAEGEEGGSNEGTDGPSDTVWGTLKPMLEEVSQLSTASAAKYHRKLLTKIRPTTTPFPSQTTDYNPFAGRPQHRSTVSPADHVGISPPRPTPHDSTNPPPYQR